MKTRAVRSVLLFLFGLTQKNMPSINKIFWEIPNWSMCGENSYLVIFHVAKSTGWSSVAIVLQIADRFRGGFRSDSRRIAQRTMTNMVLCSELN